MHRWSRAGLAASLFWLVSPATAQQAADGDNASAVDFSVVYTAETWRNVHGGFNRGSRYLDNLDVTLTVDAERAFGWRDATLFFYGLYNNGRPFAEDLVGASQGVSNIETSVRSARLYEAWIGQRFASGRASVKFGLYDLNSEFDAAESAALFLNPSHGIGPDFAQSGQNGPSIFPVTSLALRGDYAIADNWLIRAAILDAVPGNPNRPGRTSIRLREEEGALLAFELNYLNDGTKAAAGYWRYTKQFESLPATQAEAVRRGGSDGLYIMLERRLAREAGGPQGLAGWVRIGLTDEKFNPIERYLGGGLTYTGPFRGRDGDQAGLAVGWVEFGEPYLHRKALAGDRTGPREIIVEATYRARLARWLALQPDVQYVINPGGRRAAGNALVLGLRAEIGF